MGFIKLTAEQKQNVGDTLIKSQTAGFVTRVESLDPEHLKISDIPVNSAFMAYIPNRVIQHENGECSLDALKAATHMLAGKGYDTVRCLNGIDLGPDNTYGLNGTCPYCDAAVEAHELYTMQIEEIAALKGVTDIKSDALATERADLTKAKAVALSNIRMAFPIIIIPQTIATEQGRRVYKPVLEADGSIKMSCEIYITSEYQYNESILKSLSATQYMTPAGLVMLFNYTYDTKGKAPTKRDSAREFSASLFGDPMDANFPWGPEVGKFIVTQGEALAATFTNDYLVDNLASFALTDMASAQAKVESHMSKTRLELSTRRAAKQVIAGNSATSPAITASTSQGAIPQTPETILNAFTGTSAVTQGAPVQQAIAQPEVAQQTVPQATVQVGQPAAPQVTVS